MRARRAARLARRCQPANRGWQTMRDLPRMHSTGSNADALGGMRQSNGVWATRLSVER